MAPGQRLLGKSSSLRHVIQIKIPRNVNLEIFLLIQTKNIEKKKLEIFGGHLAKIFCEVNLEIYILSYTAVNLEIFSLKKSRDFLSFIYAVFVSPNNFLIIIIIL
jgi:hypothetical protein